MRTDAEWNRRAPEFFPCSPSASNVPTVRQFLSEIPYPPGYSRDGLDAQTVIDKFHAGLDGIVARPQRDRIVEAAMDLDRSADCRALTATLAVAPRP